MDDCSVNCPSVCDGFVDCDASTACTAAHCEDTHCNDTGPACFDDHCCGDTGHSLESLLGFGGPLLDTNDLLSTEQSVKTGETEPVDQSAGNLLIPYPAGYCDHGSHFDCHTFPSPKDTDGTTNPYTQGVDPAEVLNMLGMCPDYSGCHNYLPDGNCHPGKLNGNPQSPFGCFHPLPHLNTHKSPVSQVKGPCRSHHCHHSRSSYAYSPYSRHSRSSVSSQLLSSPSETPLSREFSPEIDFHVCKWATDGVPCGASFPDAGALQDHLVSSHLLTVDGPKGNGFYCRWEGCHRPDEPFSQKSKLQGHFLTHSNCQSSCTCILPD